MTKSFISSLTSEKKELKRILSIQFNVNREDQKEIYSFGRYYTNIYDSRIWFKELGTIASKLVNRNSRQCKD
jgi:hypothetical protein